MVNWSCVGGVELSRVVMVEWSCVGVVQLSQVVMVGGNGMKLCWWS